jgi:two-component system OmpR family response regulator
VALISIDDNGPVSAPEGGNTLSGWVTGGKQVAMCSPDGSPLRALVVDDELALTEVIAMALRYEGWQVSTAADGTSALVEARRNPPDVVVLDGMLPDMDGLDVLRHLRGQQPALPVLLLTARDSVEERLAGLSAGSDDYVTKPFSLEELILRLRSLVRRVGAAVVEGSARIVVGDLILDEDSFEVTRAGQPISLTSREFEVLRILMHNARRVVSKSEILDWVWDHDFGGRVGVVELYISYLRKKIDSGHPPMIHTLRGVGYILKPATR